MTYRVMNAWKNPKIYNRFGLCMQNTHLDYDNRPTNYMLYLLCFISSSFLNCLFLKGQVQARRLKIKISYKYDLFDYLNNLARHDPQVLPLNVDFNRLPQVIITLLKKIIRNSKVKFKCCTYTFSNSTHCVSYIS